MSIRDCVQVLQWEAVFSDSVVLRVTVPDTRKDKQRQCGCSVCVSTYACVHLGLPLCMYISVNLYVYACVFVCVCILCAFLCVCV